MQMVVRSEGKVVLVPQAGVPTFGDMPCAGNCHVKPKAMTTQLLLLLAALGLAAVSCAPA
jgi:hypothetical protein